MIFEDYHQNYQNNPAEAHVPAEADHPGVLKKQPGPQQ